MVDFFSSHRRGPLCARWRDVHRLRALLVVDLVWIWGRVRAVGFLSSGVRAWWVALNYFYDFGFCKKRVGISWGECGRQTGRRRGAKPSEWRVRTALSLSLGVYKYSSSPSLSSLSSFLPTHPATLPPRPDAPPIHYFALHHKPKDAEANKTDRHHVHPSLLQVREHHRHLHQLLRLRPRRVPDLRLSSLLTPLQ